MLLTLGVEWGQVAIFTAVDHVGQLSMELELSK